MKIKITKYTGILIAIFLVSVFIRFYQLDACGFSTDEPVIITSGIKHFLDNPYSVSLYDMATPGGQWPIGLFVTLLSDTDFSPIRDYGIMDYADIDLNVELLQGLEFFARLPSAIAGVLSGIFVYLLVKEMYGRKSGIVSYLLFTFNPIIIDYSRIALLEIFQIFYMLAAMYFFYIALTKKKNSTINLVISSVFFGLTAAAKLNGLMLIPLFTLFSIVSKVSFSKKKHLVVDIIGVVKNLVILIGVSLFILALVFGFDLSVPYQVYTYYSSAGGAGVQFVLFNLIYDSLFFINPIVWICLFASFYLIYKDRNELKLNDMFSILLILILLISGFFEAHESIKRGIQYVLFIFIISGRIFSKNNTSIFKSKYWTYAIIFIAISNLALVAYYFPNTGLSKSIICTSQDCISAHNTRNFDSRIVGEYLNSLENAIVYDSISTTGLVAFYLDDSNYVNGGIARLQLGECPSFEVLKDSGFNYVINNSGCSSVLLDDLNNCEYISLYIRNYEMTQIYNISDC